MSKYGGVCDNQEIIQNSNGEVFACRRTAMNTVHS
jgi:hypothetical protein